MRRMLMVAVVLAAVLEGRGATELHAWSGGGLHKQHHEEHERHQSGRVPR